MSSNTICIVIGTRPEVVKLAPVLFELRKSSNLRPFVLSTGQHREMLDQTLGTFGIVADHDLRLMHTGPSVAEMTCNITSACYNFFDILRPDAVLVQGDTNTVLGAALASFYLHIPVGHVEAGLRTYDITSPWPEEMNRRLASQLATWHFAPTQKSLQNLVDEKVPSQQCYNTGNTVIDSLLFMRNSMSDNDEATAVRMSRQIGASESFTTRFLLRKGEPWILVTAHRRESIGTGIESICHAIRAIVRQHPSVGVLFPVHLNPEVRRTVMKVLDDVSRVQLVEPVEYSAFVWLMNRCYFIISDSGGVQEEAPSLGKPVLVTRETTERPEGVAAGTCRLVGTDSGLILREASLLISDLDEYTRRSRLQNPYGDGTASSKIRAVLEHHFRR